MNRRNFMKAAALAPFFGALGGRAAETGAAAAAAGDGKPWCGKNHPLAGKKLPPWKPGEFQVHFIYTGVAESMFWILPDGTTMLLDCGDHKAWARGKLAIWILPNGTKNAGEWIARYVTRVNPAKTAVDYMMLSHHHSDHGGGEHWGAGTREWNGQQICVRRAVRPQLLRPHAQGLPLPHGTRRTQDGEVQRRRRQPGGHAQGRRRLPVLLHHQHHGQRQDPLPQRRGARPLRGGFYTAGDFSDSPKLPDGSRRNIEAELAKELDPVDVAKVNHHAHHSMPTELVAALQARVWTACMWDQLHITADSLARISDRAAYPGPRLIAPAVFTPERRFEDEGKDFLRDIAPEAFDAGHVVLTVAPGGNTYTVAYVTADNESMKVTGAYDFPSRHAEA